MTRRTTRLRTSGENLFVVLLMMAPPSQELEPPINPRRLKPSGEYWLNRNTATVASPHMNGSRAQASSGFGPATSRNRGCSGKGEGSELGNLRNRIAPLGDLCHRVPLELFTEIGFAHHGLLASKLGKKASINLGAIQTMPSFHRSKFRKHRTASYPPALAPELQGVNLQSCVNYQAIDHRSPDFRSIIAETDIGIPCGCVADE
jgi:hypothetical protein